MQFSSLFSTVLAISSATLAVANSVTFVSQDSTDRTIIFTATDGGEKLPSLEVAGGGSEKATFPDGWIGNWFSVSKGASSEPGMLGEVAFQGWNDLTYFDVSAIVNALDHDGVKEMWPAQSKTPTSGCEVFPCDNAYYLPDDVQTKTTKEVDLVCTLGN